MGRFGTRDPRPVLMPPLKAPPSAAAPPPPLTFDPTNPFIVQSDRSVLVEVDNPKYAEARDALAPFAELEKSPEHIHTYRISNLSLWNAAAAGFTAEQMVDVLRQVHQVPDPAQPAGRHRRDGQPVRPGEARRGPTTASSEAGLRRQAAAGGALPAEEAQGVPRRQARRRELRRRAGVPRRAQAGAHHRRLPGRGPGRVHGRGRPADRAARRWPRPGCRSTSATTSGRRPTCSTPAATSAAASGVIVLPCGAGKTIVGIAAMAPAPEEHAGADHQHHGGQAVAAGDHRQDRR